MNVRIAKINKYKYNIKGEDRSHTKNVLFLMNMVFEERKEKKKKRKEGEQTIEAKVQKSMWHVSRSVNNRVDLVAATGDWLHQLCLRSRVSPFNTLNRLKNVILHSSSHPSVLP